MNIDQLVYERDLARNQKDYKKSDEIRDLLDKELVFVFDNTWGQQVYYLTENYFKKKPEGMSNRKFVEYRIQQDIRAEKMFESWLYTVRQTQGKKSINISDL